MRPIDADALKEFIDDCEICNICPQKAPRCSYDCDFPECVTEKWNVAIDAQPTIDAVSEWIPCSERLPSEKDYIGDVVIWCTDKSIVGVGWYYESTKSWATIDDTFPPILGEVIAWMPLPKPYGERKESE